MPADGSIIIDTRVNNKGAEADLKALQAKAKSTAQQIAALDKQLNTATGKRTKLADDLDKAKAAAQDTAAALEAVNAQARRGQGKKRGAGAGRISLHVGEKTFRASQKAAHSDRALLRFPRAKSSRRNTTSKRRRSRRLAKNTTSSRPKCSA